MKQIPPKGMHPVEPVFTGAIFLLDHSFFGQLVFEPYIMREIGVFTG